jgi:ATP-independent RNA helicase DbpA
MNTQNIKLPKAMLDNLEQLGYKTLTPIQEKALPVILEKKDLIAQAKTGSGKTAAFGIGTLLQINKKLFAPQSLIICPTRELAQQVVNELKLLAKFTQNIKITTLTGGTSLTRQVYSLKHGTHILVGTPGRLIDHLSRQNIQIEHIKTLILDEADKMIEMGFMEQLETILNYLPKEKQTLLFSATYPKAIKQLSNTFMQDPQMIKVDTTHQKNTIQSFFYQPQKSDKIEVLAQCLSHYKPKSTIIFANTKNDVDRINDDLYDLGFDIIGLHGDFDQIERNETLLQFSNKSISILVATDVASRGIDIKDLDCVINYELPHNEEVYTHRIGRTGRAGKEGMSISFIDHRINIKEYFKEEIKIEDLKSLEPFNSNNIQKASMATLCIYGGKKDKLRAGDIVGAFTNDFGLKYDDIGDINILRVHTYVALKKEVLKKAFNALKNGRIKKMNFKVWTLT